MKKQLDNLLRMLGLVALLLISITVFNRSRAAVGVDTLPFNAPMPKYFYSISLTGGTSFNRANMGAVATIEDRLLQMQLSVEITSKGEPLVRIKPGVTLARDGNTRVLISPLGLVGGAGNEFFLSHGFTFTRTFGHFVASAGADVWVTRQKEIYWPALSGEFTWSPNISLKYDIVGSSYYPNIKKKKLPISHKLAGRS